MKKSIHVLSVMIVATAIAQAQGNASPASQDVKPPAAVTSPVPVLPNPYRIASGQDAIIKAVAQVMRDRKMVVDEAVSIPTQGFVSTQPYIFVKGTRSKLELGRLIKSFPDPIVLERTVVEPIVVEQIWSRGRYSFMIEVQRIDGAAVNIAVSVKIEGRNDGFVDAADIKAGGLAGATGGTWVTLESNGIAEQELLQALLAKIPMDRRNPED